MTVQTVRVQLERSGYDIVVGGGLISSIGQRVRGVISERASRAFVVVDSGVPRAHVKGLVESVEGAGLRAHVEVITPSESVKSLESYGRLLAGIAGTNHGRMDPVISLGGGIVCDLAGFVAASYRRGVPVVQCPSTLLAMVDASVGGKTGVNLTLGTGGVMKNLVGAFHQPSLVCADVGLLDSLEGRHRRSGLSECIKHAWICRSVGHESLRGWMDENLDSICGFDPAIIEELVARNVALKASVVARDEHESPEAIAGGRMLLNFGHTFGHAIETLEGVSPDGDPGNAPLHHGEAVALGMVAACRCAQALGRCPPSIGDSLCEMLTRVGLPWRVSGLVSTDEIIERMGHDKKAVGSTIRLVLPTGEGCCEIVDDASAESVQAGIESIRG